MRRRPDKTLDEGLDGNDLPDLALVEFHAEEVRVPVRAEFDDGHGGAAPRTGVVLGRRMAVAWSHTGIRLPVFDAATGRTRLSGLKGRKWLASAGKNKTTGELEWTLREIPRKARNGTLDIIDCRPARPAETELLEQWFPGHLDAWRNRTEFEEGSRTEGPEPRT